MLSTELRRRKIRKEANSGNDIDLFFSEVRLYDEVKRLHKTRGMNAKEIVEELEEEIETVYKGDMEKGVEMVENWLDPDFPENQHEGI